MKKALNFIASSLKRSIGFLFPRTVRQKVYWWLNPPDPRKHIDLIFDIVGSCNLRCPSCPVGSIGAINPNGKMSFQTYQKILNKASQEYFVQNLVLYNWGESFFHPELAQFIRFAKQLNISVSLSTNLNVLRNMEAVLKENPNAIRVSLSGFTQKTYGVTHREGNIEAVKENLRKLAQIKRDVGNTETVITVYYHKYRNNLNELPMMKAFATELGFEWSETWAYYMPFEKAADYADGLLPLPDREFVETQLALPLNRAIQAATEFKNEPCLLLENQIVLDLKGDLLLCCAVYDYSKNRLGSFLEMNQNQITQAKSSHPSCERCTKHGLHKYFLWEGHPKLSQTYEQLVKENLEGTLVPTPASENYRAGINHTGQG